MPLKIFHTADLHIGMKFNNYPETIRECLAEARYDVLDRMIERANAKQCNLFVMAGDLFNSINITKQNVERVAASLNSFKGECVLIIPGNHDYDNGMIDLWNYFKGKIMDNILYMNEERPFSLGQYGLDVMVYPAPCHSKHSDTNNIGWIKDIGEFDPKLLHIGIAHGALEGISPDMERKYFYMTKRELKDIPMDIWLLGHTHADYPENDIVKDWKIFNPGTPEPDGLDCNHGGYAWMIIVDANRSIKAQKIKTGLYRFCDSEFQINDDGDLHRMKDIMLAGTPDKKIVRVTLRGRVGRDAFNQRQKIYSELYDKTAYAIIEDSNLCVRITKDIIDSEFTSGSFPHRFLTELAEDDEALQIAYELIQGVREC